MRATIYWALARGVLLESLRRKDVWVVAILGLLILLAATALGIVGIAGLEIFIKDLAVTILGIFSTILAGLVSCRVLPDEIRNRTLYPLLARPVGRGDLLIGKYIGAVLVSWVGFALLSGLIGLVLIAFHIPIGTIALQYVLLKAIGLTIVCAVGLCLSTCMTPAAAATMTFILAFGSPMLSRAIVMTGQSSPGLVPLCKFVNALLPQVHLFDIGARFVYVQWSPVSMGVVLALLAYASLYVSASLFGGWAAFRRKAL